MRDSVAVAISTRFVGANTPRDDPDLYIACVESLIDEYLNLSAPGSDEDVHVPLIVNTHGWVKGVSRVHAANVYMQANA